MQRILPADIDITMYTIPSLLLLAGSPVIAQTQKQPNIIVFLVDDMKRHFE